MINCFDDIMRCPGNNPEVVMKGVADFLKSQKIVLNILKNLDDAMLNQREIVIGIKGLARSLGMVTEILQQLTVETDEAKIRLAEINLELGRIITEVGYLLERVNKENNGFWKFMITGVIIAFGICGVCYFKDDVMELVSDNTESKPCR